MRLDPKDAAYLQEEEEEQNWSNEKIKIIETKKPRPRDIIYRSKKAKRQVQSMRVSPRKEHLPEQQEETFGLNSDLQPPFIPVVQKEMNINELTSNLTTKETKPLTASNAMRPNTGYSQMRENLVYVHSPQHGERPNSTSQTLRHPSVGNRFRNQKKMSVKMQWAFQ